MIFIRADANEIIGIGHVMRCLSIAAQIRELDNDVIFLIADNRARPMIEDQKYPVICLNSQWNDLDKELDFIINLLQSYKNSKILIDTYFVTNKYLEALKNVATTYYIDDLNSMRYPVDVLINYNIYGTELDYSGTCGNVRLLLGTSYAPLRNEFTNILKRDFCGIRSVLITSGGTDNYNIINHILSVLLSTDIFRDTEYYCILGRFNMNVDFLKDKFGSSQNIHFLQNVSNIDYYMRKCDVAITAGGSTTYELCACGVPSILYSVADNQLGIAESFSTKDIIPWVGDIRNDMPSCLENIVSELKKLKDGSLWKRRSEQMQRLVDGNGALRIAREIINDSVCT